MTSDVQTIALVSSGEMDVGGIETHLLSLAAWGERRYRWLYIGPATAQFTAAAQAVGMPVLPWSAPGHYHPAAVRQLARIFREQQVVLVHSHLARASLHAGLAARATGIPLVVTVHGPSYHYAGAQRNPLIRWVNARAERYINRRLARQVIFVSSRVYHEAVATGICPAEHGVVIPNGIDTMRFAPQPAVDSQYLARKQGALVLGYLGRLSAEKGPDLLLAALQQAQIDARLLQVWLVGDGPQRPALETQRDAAGLQQQVHFLGFHQDTADILAATDFMVLPSRAEVMSVALLEALAAGKPCIVSNIGENGVVVRNGQEGLVIPAEDSGALAAAIRALCDDAGMRAAMAAQARRRGLEYDIRTQVARVTAVYDAVLQNRT